jgi:uncharacterized protein YcbK (DUF882 family)
LGADIFDRSVRRLLASLAATSWIALATPALAKAPRGQGGSDGPVEGEAAGPAAAQSVQAQPKKAASKKRGRKPRFAGFAVPESDLRPEPFPRPSGDLYVYSPNWHEEIKVNIYNPDGSFNQEALKAISHVMRCKRTDTEKPVEPHLFEILSAISDHFGGRRLEIISGFRNQRKVTSFHFHATAADIRVDGVSEKQVRDFASSLDSGGMGVGIYPNAHFVHVDVRPWPSFRWTDYSRSGDGATGRLPPRGFKKKPPPES